MASLDRHQRTVWCSGLPPGADEYGVAFHFNAVAPVEEVRVLRRGLLGASRGLLAVVVLRDANDVARVCSALNGVPFEGQRLRVVVPITAGRSARA